MNSIARALLLLGPTGSGKSPQGRLLGNLPGYCHLDFGAELRRAAAHPEGTGDLTAADLTFIRELLSAHALLPDNRFDIARKVLTGFLSRAKFDPGRQVLVLNGLPRTLSQARDMADLVRVEQVVVLEADEPTVRARVARRQHGQGLDEHHRADDAAEAIPTKLAIYRRQTEPLIAHYRGAGVPVLHFRVTGESDDRALHRQIVAALTAAQAGRLAVGSPGNGLASHSWQARASRNQGAG